jgi:hypothetical protein
MADEQHSEEVQRRTAKRRSALVLSLLKEETTAADAARRHGLKVAEVEEWRDRFLLGAENALRARLVGPSTHGDSASASAGPQESRAAERRAVVKWM